MKDANDGSDSEPMVSVLDGERFDALSVVVGQVAHDFNNLLTPLLAYPALIRDDLPEGSSSASLVNAIEKTARDMSRITRQLLELTSRRPQPSSEVDVRATLENVLQGLRQDPELKVRNLRFLPGEACRVFGMPERLGMALQHVCRNACEAAGTAGDVTVDCRVERVVAPGGAPGSEQVRVRVVDTGPGIAGEIRAKLFEPFVTTKRAGGRRGAGLGLSIAYRVVRDHGGTIELASAPGTGTEVTILLPADGADGREGGSGEPGGSAVPEPTKAGEAGMGRNRNRILLVDDENSILRLFEMILNTAFPEVEVDLAGNGREAVDAFCRHRHGIILMDLHMPVMDGVTAFERVGEICRKRGWEMPSVIFCTGYAPPESIRLLVSEGGLHAFLKKPVRNEVLVDEVRRRLAP